MRHSAILEYPGIRQVMTLELNSDIAEALAILAAERGISVEECLREMIAYELASGQPRETGATQVASGLVIENGLLIYGAGTALPREVVDNAIRRSREDRFRRVLGTPA
jgi:hypothetical protein